MSKQESPKAVVVFLPSSQFAVERVFPIRNLVGYTRETEEEDVLQQMIETKEEDELISRNAGRTSSDSSVEVPKQQDASSKLLLPSPHYTNVPPDHAIRKLSIPDSAVDDPEKHGRRRTERTKFIPTRSGAPNVLPGIISDRATPTFQRCEDEPIHTPGAVQQYGVLLALKFKGDEEQDLEVRIASENAHMLLGYGPEQLFQLQTFFDILDSESCEELLERAHSALSKRNDEESMEKTEDTQLDVFSVTVVLPSGSHGQLWCALHISNGTHDLIILEFEPYTEIFCQSEVDHQKTLPSEPVHVVDVDAQPEEQRLSTTRKSTPLRVMEIARRHRQNAVSSMDVFSAMNQAQQQLAGARSVQQVLDIVVGIVAELTGFHRVMFYRFDSQKNGCVDAELVDPQASSDLFRGKQHLI